MELRNNIVAHRGEARMRQTIDDVLFRARIVVMAYHLAAILKQPLAETRADKPAPPVTRTAVMDSPANTRNPSHNGGAASAKVHSRRCVISTMKVV
jgi:hypothetical protein